MDSSVCQTLSFSILIQGNKLQKIHIFSPPKLGTWRYSSKAGTFYSSTSLKLGLLVFGQGNHILP